MSSSSTRYLSEKQACEYLGISSKTLQRLRTTGYGPTFIKLTGRVLYDRCDLDSFLESRKVQSTSAYGGDHV